MTGRGFVTTTVACLLIAAITGTGVYASATAPRAGSVTYTGQVLFQPDSIVKVTVFGSEANRRVRINIRRFPVNCNDGQEETRTHGAFTAHLRKNGKFRVWRFANRNTVKVLYEVEGQVLGSHVVKGTVLYISDVFSPDGRDCSTGGTGPLAR